MTPKRRAKGSLMRFQRIGGSAQLCMDKPEAFAQVLELDEAFWAMTSIDISIIRFEPQFLKILDTDCNGKIRCDEIKNAVRFLLNNLTDLSGAVAGSDVLKLAAINADTSEGAVILAAARTILHNLDREDAQEISLDEALGLQKILGRTDNNGDGVITPVDSMSREMKEAIDAIIASGRSTVDLSGITGVSIENIDDFKAAVQARCRHLDQPLNDPSIIPYGNETETIYLLYSDLAGLIDEYFLNSAAKNFLTPLPERTQKLDLTADLLSAGGVRQVLATASLAIPTGRAELALDAELNPLYAEKMKKLAATPLLSSRIQEHKLSLEAWQSAKAEIAPYLRWRSEETEGDDLNALSEKTLRNFCSGTVLDDLRSLAETDAATVEALSGRGTLIKLLYLQYHLREFLNNFVNLSELFRPDRPSRLQCGSLVLDGRRFTLVCPVQNLDEHKRIVVSSNICVFYVELFQGGDGAVGKQLLAVGVTSGGKRNLFVGKRGVFFDANGEIRDARIVDIVIQPVSICEALKSPFFRFADFLGKQTEKIFNTRNADVQKNIGKELSSTLPAQSLPGNKTPQPAAAGNNGLAMMLMGGGIGLAAIGSSLAFIVKSLQNISFSRIVTILLGIIVIFGGPLVIISLVKLFSRNLSRFLESSGCAINQPMRLSHKMGRFFTYIPSRPRAWTSRIDLLDTLPQLSGKFFSVKRAVLLLLALLLAAAGVIFGVRACRKCSRCTVRTAIEVVTPPEKPAAPITNRNPNSNRSL